MGFFVSELHRDFNILSALSVFKTEGACSGPLTDLITECFCSCFVLRGTHLQKYHHKDQLLK